MVFENNVSTSDSKVKIDHKFKSEGQCNNLSLFQTCRIMEIVSYFKSILVLIVLFVSFDSLCPSQQFFCYTGMDLYW